MTAQESKNQEVAPEKQVDKLQQQLVDVQLYPSSKQRYTYALSLLIVKSDFLYSKSVTPHHSTRSISYCS